MKKKYFLSLFLLTQICAFGQNIVFADANFKALLLVPGPNNYAYDSNGNYVIIDTNSDNEIQYSEALAVYGLSLSSTTVTSIEGIEYFTNLHSIYLGLANLTDLPISSLIQLEYFGVNSNVLNSLAPVENLYALQRLDISFTLVTSFNFQNLSQLTRLECSSTPLTEINLCGTAVRSAWISNNLQLQSLILKNNVVTPETRISQTGPPPLPNFMFSGNPSINYICYDEGEYNAVVYDLDTPLNNITFSTSCESSCLLSTSSFDSGMTLHPNPVNNFITIENKEANKINTVLIFNALGQLVKTVANPSVSETMTMNIAELKSGTYFVEIISNQGKSTKKFVKL